MKHNYVHRLIALFSSLVLIASPALGLIAGSAPWAVPSAHAQGSGQPRAFLPVTARNWSGLAQASATVSSDQSAVIATGTGVSLTVPRGAVSPTADGQTGTVVFSITENPDATAPPAGYVPLGSAYAFAPSGLNFSAPVKLTFPVPGGVDPPAVGIMRYDEATRSWLTAPATTDAGARTVSLETQHFTTYRAVASDTYRSLARFHWSVLRGTGGDNVLGTWICVASATLASGASTALYTWPQWSRSVPLATDAPFENSLPAGRYTFFYRWGGPSPDTVRYAETGPVDLGSSVPTTVYLTVPPSAGEVRQGYPPCLGVLDQGVPHPSPGTGEVQITLNWDTDVDLDLHVVEPSGERIWWDDPNSATNGRLDLDNQCYGFVRGRPENIYWPPPGSGGAPSGHYQIQVVWYQTCSGTITEVPLSVRIVIRGRIFTFRKAFTGGPDPNSPMTVATCLKQPAATGETPLCW